MLYASLVQVPPISDFGWYHARAVSLAQGQGYAVDGVLTSFWPVGYPAFLGGLYTVFGTSTTVGLVANVLLAGAVLLLIPVVGRSLGLSARAQVWAVALWAIWPNQVAYASLLSAEPLAQALLLSGAALLFTVRRPGWAGLVWGLGALVKPHFILIPIVWGLAAAWRRRRRPDDAFAAALPARAITGCLVIATATLLPWTLRNAMVWDRPVFVSTNGGYNLLIGANRTADGGWMEVRGMVPANPNEAQLDRAFLASGLRAIRQDPGRWIGLAPVKVGHLFWPSNEAAHWATASLPNLTKDLRMADQRRILGITKAVAGGWGILLIGLLPVAILVLIRRRPGTPILTATASLLSIWVALHALLFGDPRFLAPLTPWLTMTLAAAYEALRQPENRV